MAGEGAGDRQINRERGAGAISIKSDTVCIDKDPNSGSILGNNFKLHVCHGKVETETRISPAQRGQIVTHFTILLNALENSIRAQARARGSATLKNTIYALRMCVCS